MANQALTTAETVLCSSTATTLGAESPQTFTTGNGTLTFQSTGKEILHFHITTQGTSLVFAALSSANNVTYTTTGTNEVLIGPFDPNLFGTGTITVTNTGVAGSAAMYNVPKVFPSAQHNPFEATNTALDF